MPMMTVEALHARAHELLDTDHPAGALLAHTAHVDAQLDTEPFGGPLSRRVRYIATHTWTLREATPLRVTFAREGVREKIFKLFNDEVEVGDPAFDDAVFVSTDTPAPVQLLLTCEDFREAVRQFIALDGEVSVDGERVTILCTGATEEQAEPNHPAVFTIIAHLIALATADEGSV